MYYINFLYRLTVQALRTTPLRLMLLAQALAIAAQLSVLLTANQYQQLFNQEAAVLLGGDMVINADREPSESVLKTAQSMGLHIAKTMVFNSIVLSIHTNNPQQTLVSVKAVDSSYPLRGKVTLSKSIASQSNTPKLGQVWVDADLLTRLHVQLGEKIQLGEQLLTIAAIIDNEPDRGIQFINIAPRVMLVQADLARTKLLGAGSRVSYRWQLAGTVSAQTQFKQWLSRHSVLGLRLETLEENQPQMRTNLDRATALLGLIAILTTLIAGCGLSLVAHIWSQEQAKTVALLRTLGASRYEVMKRLLGQIIVISLLGLGLGYLLGYGVHKILAHYILMNHKVILPISEYKPYIQALYLLMILLISCIWIPIHRVLNIRPIHILRDQLIKTLTQNNHKDSILTHSIPTNNISSYSICNTTPFIYYIKNKLCIFNKINIKDIGFKMIPYGVGLIGILTILIWVSGHIKQGIILFSGLLLLVIIVLILVYGLMALAVMLGRQHTIWTVRMASRGILRNKSLTLVQATSLTIALFGLLMLSSMQRDILSTWKTLLPANAPNYFLLNIQPDQSKAVKNYLLNIGISDPHLQPMIKARLIRVNNKTINSQDYNNQRAKNLLNREFNLSYNTQLPQGNTVSAGVWHGDTVLKNKQNQWINQISMEDGIIHALNLKLGDMLTFDIAGQTMVYTLTSVRKLRWESLNVNFFAIASPSSIPIMAVDLPQTYISAIFVPSYGANQILNMVRTFSNITVLDLGKISVQAMAVLNKIGQAITVLLVLSSVAAVLVVCIIAYASRLSRQKETVLLHVLGASRLQITLAQLLEQVLIGTISGLIAGISTYILIQVLGQWILDLPINTGFLSVGLGTVLGLLANIFGYLAFQIHNDFKNLSQQFRIFI